MSLIPRGFAALALVAATTGVVAPAASAAAAPQLSVFLPNVIVGPDSNGKAEQVYVISSEPVQATQLKVVVDFSGLAGIATVTPQSSNQPCSTVAAVITCVHPTEFIDGFKVVQPSFAVKPLAGVAPGVSGKWKATISADGLTAASAEATVTVAEAVDLSVPVEDVDVTSTPGGTFSQSLGVDNVGDVTAKGVAAILYSPHAFITTKQYSNCTFFDGQMTSCVFDEQVEPGNSYATHEPIPFKLRPDTLAPGSQALEIEWMTKDDFAIFKATADASGQDFFGQPGTGDKLTLVASPQAAVTDVPQTEIDPSDNSFHIGVTVQGDNDSDRAAIGGTASGTATQVVTLNLGVKNLGPATTDHGRILGFATVDITLPPGSSLTEMPADCVAMTSIGEEGQLDPNEDNLAARFIRCADPSTVLLAGAQVTFPVKLKIDQVVTGATGAVAVLTSGCDGCRQDKNPANDTASVVLNGTLPTTGVQTGLIAGTGALLALGGTAIFLLGRRRRSKVIE